MRIINSFWRSLAVQKSIIVQRVKRNKNNKLRIDYKCDDDKWKIIV